MTQQNKSPALKLGDNVFISETAKLYPSQRGSLITVGSNSQIYDFVCIRCVGGIGNVEIGAHNYINAGCVLYSGNGIKMGDYVLLAPGVKIMPTNHSFERRDVPIRCQGFAPSKGGVVVEDDVWIGANSVILDGAHICNGAIIAAGSVVRGVVPAFQIWGGVPARFISERGANAIIEFD